MAEDTKVLEAPTSMASDLKAKTDAAVSAVAGFDDPEFERSLQEAMDKDAGKTTTVKPDEGSEPDAAAVEAAAKAELEAKNKAATTEKKVTAQTGDDDLPEALLGGEKKTETKPVDDATAEAERKKFIEDQTKGMTPKAADRFKKIEQRAYEAEQRAKKIESDRQTEKSALQKQIEDVSQKAAKVDDAEVQKLRKQVEELDAVVQKSAIQEHPGFKAKFDNQISSEIERAKKLVPAEITEEVTHLLALQESPRRNARINELADGLDDLSKSKFLASVGILDRLTGERSEALNNWKEGKVHTEAHQIQEREKQTAQAEHERLVAWDKGIKAASDSETGFEVFRKLDGNDDWNAKVDSRISVAKSILTEAMSSPEKQVELAARAVAASDYRKMFLAQRILVKRLSEELESLKSAEPNAGDEGGSIQNAGDDNDDFVTAAIKGAIKAGGLRE